MLQVRKWNQTRRHGARGQIKNPVTHARTPIGRVKESRETSSCCLILWTLIQLTFEAFGPGSNHLYTNVATLHCVGIYWDHSQLYVGHNSYIAHWLRI